VRSVSAMRVSVMAGPGRPSRPAPGRPRAQVLDKRLECRTPQRPPLPIWKPDPAVPAYAKRLAVSSHPFAGPAGRGARGRRIASCAGTTSRAGGAASAQGSLRHAIWSQDSGRFRGVQMVLPVWIEHTTSPLPRECSTTELRQQSRAFRNSIRARVTGRSHALIGWPALEFPATTIYKRKRFKAMAAAEGRKNGWDPQFTKALP
jgi:hypothetical protein